MRSPYLSFGLSMVSMAVWSLRYLPSWRDVALMWIVLTTALSLIIAVVSVIVGARAVVTPRTRWASGLGMALGALCILGSSILLGLLGLGQVLRHG